MNKFFGIVIQFVLLIDITKQSKVKQAITAFKAIGKTIKTPLLKTIGNTKKMPVFKKFSNTMKNSLSMLRINKNIVKNVACGVQEKYLTSRHNLGIRAVKYLGEKGITNFKYLTPQAAKGGKQLAMTEARKNIQTRSATQMSRKGLRSVVKKSSEQINAKEFSTLIKMVIKNKPQLPFLFAVGGLPKLTEFNLTTKENTDNYPKDGILKIDPLDENDEPVEYNENFKYERIIKQRQEDISEIAARKQILRKDAPIGSHMYVYKGDSVDGQMEGKGRMVYRNGYIYEGEFKKGKYHGKGKEMFINQEDVYEGDYVDGEMEGKGKLIYMYGQYVGDFVKGKCHGKGIEMIPHKYTYEGDFVEGEMEGKGKIKYDCGDMYEGDFVKGKYHGKGEETLSNRDTYDGDFVDGLRHGQGEYNTGGGGYSDGPGPKGKRTGQNNVLLRLDGETYEGGFVKGKFEGRGKLTKAVGEAYEGDFKAGEEDGNGAYSFFDKSWYIGKWSKGVRRGYGEYHWLNGDHYKGNWQDDQYHGHGEMYTKKTKTTKKAFWKQGHQYSREDEEKK